MIVLVTVEAVAIALLGLLVAGLLRSHAEILRALHNLGAGIDPDAAPSPMVAPRGGATETSVSDVVGTTPAGDSIAVGLQGSGEPTLLAFLTSGCQTCAGFWEAFGKADQLSVPGGARLVVVTKGPEHESQSRVAELAPSQLPVVMSDQAWEAYGVPVAPYFIYVDGASERIVGEGAAGTWDHVADLCQRALRDSGLADRGARRRRRREPSGDAPSRVDADLLSAGIHPGHPSLYQSPVSPEGPGEET